MAIHWREDLKRRWAILVYADPYTAREWDDAMAEVMAHPISAPPLRLLVDRRYCAVPSTPFVERMVSFAEMHGERFEGARIAVVVESAASFGMGRMLEIKLENSGVRAAARVFRDWTEAEHWLAGTSRPPEGRTA